MYRRTVLPLFALAATLVCVVGACAPSHVQTGSTSSLHRETRGWLGINIQDFTDPNGALVTDVATDSPPNFNALTASYWAFFDSIFEGLVSWN